jgi:hypothetical protein
VPPAVDRVDAVAHQRGGVASAVLPLAVTMRKLR